MHSRMGIGIWDRTWGCDFVELSIGRRKVVYADDGDGVEVGWNGVAIADGVEGDGGVTVEGGVR